MSHPTEPPIQAVDTNAQLISDTVDFVYSIEGTSSLELGELIPILVSLGELIQEGNRIANPEDPEIAISVKPFEEGSFHY